VGKWLGAAGQGIFMLGVLFLVGGILFRINLGPDPFSLAVTSLLCSTAAASVFLLLALVSPSEKFMDNLASVVILVSAMLGGNLIPLESMPDWMSRFGQFGFNYWANLSFQHIMVEDVGIGAQPRPVVVLAAVSGVLLVVNLGIFRLRASKGGLA
jgi:ABC-type multidrug transport system permease subunit